MITAFLCLSYTPCMILHLQTKFLPEQQDSCKRYISSRGFNISTQSNNCGGIFEQFYVDLAISCTCTINHPTAKKKKDIKPQNRRMVTKAYSVIIMCQTALISWLRGFLALGDVPSPVPTNPRSLTARKLQKGHVQPLPVQARSISLPPPGQSHREDSQRVQ